MKAATQRVFRGLAVAGFAALAVSGCASGLNDIGRAVDKGVSAVTAPFTEAEEREITMALWSGTPTAAPVPGRLPVINVRNGSRTISGPQPWRHPVTGETLQVYERRNAEKDGSEKVQYFTIRPDGTALARVFDRRPGQPDRVFVGDAFFPLGTWRDGEKRNYTMTEYSGGRAQQRNIALIMKKVDFSYRGAAHSARYDWIQTAMNGDTVFHERFTYSPGKGLAKFDNRLK